MWLAGVMDVWLARVCACSLCCSLDSLRLLEGHVTHLKLSLPEPRPPMVLLGNKKDRERQHR